MKNPEHLLDVYELYINHLRAVHPPKRADNSIQEIWWTFTNCLLVGLGHSRIPGGTKMKKSEIQAVKDFMKTQDIEAILDARIAQQKGFQLVRRSQKMQEIYQRSLEKFLAWCEEQDWWPEETRFHYSPNAKEFCCSNLQTNHGSKRRRRLTHRQNRYATYKLQPKDTSPSLQTELNEFYRFLTEPEYPQRVGDPVKPSCARNNYLRETLLFLGWFHYFEKIPIEQLCLSQLIPKIRKQDLRKLSEQQQKSLWKKHSRDIETWLSRYFNFLHETMEAVSPRSRRSKLAALSAIGKFQYYTEVEVSKDYESIPVLQVIANHLQRNYTKVSEWNNNRRYVADQKQKFPDPVKGKDILTTIHEEILEPLRLECRPKSKDNKLRDCSAIAKSEQQFLAWFFLAGLPARRQEELRDLKLALCCPVIRPSEVPINGAYYPLPPNEVRNQRYNGIVEDNYIYKTYVYQGKFYKDGLWVLDIQEYKMQDKYGPQSIKIENRRFADGTYLYDYFEHYLCGWWLPGGRKKQQIYDWWQQDLKGRRGRWVSLGRSIFEPCDACCVKNQAQHSLWVWGYFFLKPHTGERNCGSCFENLVETAAHHCTGKCISPHTMRSVWATWAYQVQLTDQEKASLAYAMGHDIDTLKKLYERTTSAEKRLPIEEAIDKFLFDELEVDQQVPQTILNTSTDSKTLKQKLQSLTASQRQQLTEIMNRQQ